MISLVHIKQAEHLTGRFTLEVLLSLKRILSILIKCDIIPSELRYHGRIKITEKQLMDVKLFL